LFLKLEEAENDVIRAAGLCMDSELKAKISSLHKTLGSGRPLAAVPMVDDSVMCWFYLFVCIWRFVAGREDKLCAV